MATYAELLALSEDDRLNKLARVAVIVAADVVRSEDVATANHAARLAWAAKALQLPEYEGKRALWCALAQNRALTSAQISGASDAAFQTAVNAAIDMLATG